MSNERLAEYIQTLECLEALGDVIYYGMVNDYSPASVAYNVQRYLVARLADR